MNALKMTFVAVALMVAGLAAQNAEAQGFSSMYGNCGVNQYAPVSYNSVPAYSTAYSGYSGGIYGNQYSQNNWNYNGYGYGNGGYNNFNHNNNHHNNWGSSNNWNNNGYGYQNYNHNQFNQYSPYSTSYMNRPFGY